MIPFLLGTLLSAVLAQDLWAQGPVSVSTESASAAPAQTSPFAAATDISSPTAISSSTAEAALSSTTISPVALSSAPVPLPGFSTGTLVFVSSAAPAAAPKATETIPGFIPRPWVLADIKVEGNKNVKTSAIRSQVKAKKGDLYDRPDLDRDVQSVLGLGNFERVTADISLTDKPTPPHLRKVAGTDRMIRLTFLVKEKPQIKKVKFVGTKKVSRGVLEDVTSMKAKDPLDNLKLRDDQEKILEKYREKGFLDAVIRADVSIDTAALTALVTYTVVEGPKSHIEIVSLDGVKAFKQKKLLKLMTNRSKGWFRAGVYSSKELKEDVKKIETFYLNNGYLDVSLSTPSVHISSDKTKIKISLSLAEGRPYKFGDTTFEGHLIFTSTELAKTIEYKRGKIFSQEKFEETIRAIQEIYADKGRLRARISPQKNFNKATDLMDVNFSIIEGNIVYIDHVDVEGNKATKTYVLKREVVVKPGQIFSLARIKKSRERIMNLGFIDDVDVDYQPVPSDPDKVDLTFDVAEGKPGMLTAGAAYSSLDGLIGTLSLQHLNLFGRAQKASAQWSFGNRVQDYSLSWMTPWVNNRPISLGFDVFNTRRVSPYDTSMSAYVEKKTGGTIRVGPRFEEDKYHLNLSYTFSRLSIMNVQEQYRGTLIEGTSNYSSASAEFARDTRDNIWDPTRGTRNSIGAQVSGGPFQGDIHFFKPWVTNSGYLTLFRIEDYPFVLSFSNRFGYITQFGETKEVPVFERFYVGGQDSLRGYAAAGEVGYPGGGKVYDVFNAEFGFPLARERKRTIVKFITFFDMGTSWDRLKDISGRIGSNERDLKTDAGCGIRFTTPAFPIRLDWGYGFNHRTGERLYQINFGLGPLF